MAISDESVSGAMDKSIDWVFKAADLVSEYCDGEEKAQHMKELEETLQTLCKIDRKFLFSKKIISQLEADNSGENEETKESLEYKQLRQALDDSLKENERKINKYNKHEKYVEFMQNYIAAKDANETGDEELVCTNAEVNIYDPYTKAMIKEPIKNTICGHHYEKSNVLAMLKRKKEQPCPNPGCSSRNFTINDLKEDHQLTKQIQQKVRETQEAMDESSSSTMNVE